jgi:hypothetical protein
MELSKKRGINRDVIKYIAMFTMLLNHISHIFLKPETLIGDSFTFVGYFTAITMCYFLVEGYSYTKSKKKYGIRLLIFALISQIPFMYALHTVKLNMLFTLLMCFLILVSMEKIDTWVLKGLAIVGLFLLCTISDWTWLAPVFTILFAKCKNSKRKMVVAYVIALMLFLLLYLSQMAVIQALLSGIGIIISGVVILCFYNGKKAERGQAFSKWFFYIFYPGHLLVLWLIQLLLF